ncbi:7,8-didemethyl-8-hydroxy-5-deazariboflavin synthase subunit CofG [Marine Group I thaumarchaeote]|uniref:7,8-didemethyl-8-hydroxy-5-deazariboflavin synthase n=1 Tax=Marine Group I thaumarchaeote TaxID=2511932 RepID=A0A7K4M7K0_9ARCH|nr:MAG: 7,8-didemethyl-8-hydroxy-5-deazariboflavin synthase subunit CofG [Nitrosopumilus sp. YT1]NWJ19507.1 7,8-didemethyl-8-hydroxy-5-deazariboflavin synthase subunit CofG [Marine Group I thaumarchaeote]NWJ30013.1 7,8-didemethyl-8-hydroxy-5-deazariboflavin synthase subunit CofG [Marine Group I thaumarchaeote]NWJ56923.1 7,8-didemethyl-8-hydroxy-5-deazariboflavin synthase subunit CofG [Marine Group I thaumarchaeote]NWK13370.1 7,8-didemethyl-8-hydroxy-5-deazariboflavin synthase subunit CofG [Mari
MSKLVLNSESLNNVLENKVISRQDIMEIYQNAVEDSSELFSVAQNLREKFKKDSVTFSKKVFFNIVNLCKDTCSYCTYKAEPDEKKLSLMSKQQILELLQLAKKYRCVEALFVTGERPEQKYQEARDWLKENGFKSTAEYLIHASELSLELGLFPHTNAGNLNFEEMRELKKTNVSMGIMLENVSERLTEKGMPHYLAASKRPKARLEVLENSGKLGIPMTTGLLVGIGETIEEIIDSILAIKQLHQKYGNIQEVILQNFQPKPDTIMKNTPSADEKYFKTIVALSRIIMPEMNIQIPPNLSPKSYQSFLSVGINDWGGISPLTPDFVNPEFSWPEIDKVDENSRNAGFELKCRFPIYPEFFSFVSKELRDKMSVIENGEGLVKEEYWR